MTPNQPQRVDALEVGRSGAGGVREALIDAARTELALAGSGKISLRAIARRAGVSHAAPKHHFADRAGLLTAVAVQGFRQLLTALENASSEADGAADGGLAALGRAYLDTGLLDPALFELMFRPELLHRDDPDLRAAQRATFELLGGAVAGVSHPRSGRTDANPAETSLVAWAFVHGLLVLIRDGALQVAADETDTEVLARRLTGSFAELLQ